MTTTWKSASGLAVVLASTWLSLVGAPAEAFDPPPAPARGYVCGKISSPLLIDGKLDEPAWAAADWTETFVDIEGVKKPAPRFQTRAKMLWDDQYFYVAAELKEPHVWATLTQHDSVIFHDPDFEVFIDPDGDNHAYYEFEINALNTGWDLFLPKPYRDGGPADNGWEIPGLKTAVAVQGTLNNPSDVDLGWTVEIAFPWSGFNRHGARAAAPVDGAQWRVNFSRVEWRITIEDAAYRKVPKTPEDNWVWSPQDAIDMHRPEYWGYVQFSDRPPGPGQVAYQPDPASTAKLALCRLYYAQKAHFVKTKSYADTLAALGLLTSDPKLGRIVMKSTPTGYTAEITVPRGDGTTQTWMIREDSRLTRLDP